MNNVSQVILRNRDRLAGGRTLLVEPAPDGLFRELGTDPLPPCLSTSSFGACNTLRSMGADVRFEAVPEPDGPVDQVIVVLPREKERLSLLLHAVGERLAPRGRLWLVGANKAGIKSSPRRLETYFEQVEKVDSARHCSLFRAEGFRPSPPFTLDACEREWHVDFAGRRLQMRSLPGAFAHGRLDAGTRLLLEAIGKVRPGGRILDFASGSGVIGLALLAAGAASRVVLLDDSAVAMESARRSLAANGLRAELLPSDGLSEATGRFDWIVSNPPFHRGVDHQLDVAAAFFRGAGTFLAENGKILVVFNRHLPYTGWLRESFNRVDCLANSREFTVIQASNNR